MVWKIVEIPGVAAASPNFDVRFLRPKAGPAKGCIRNLLVAFVAPKGGAGKTTCTLLAASSVAARGARVLVVDATEGQGGLSMRLAPEATVSGRPHGLGALVRYVHDAMDQYTGLPYTKKLQTLRDSSVGKHAVLALQEKGEVLCRISVDPDSAAAFDFLPCGSTILQKVQQDSTMGEPTTRQIVLQSVLDGLSEVYGQWDYIFVDVVPNAHSTVLKATMGVADRIAVVIDMKSSMPMAGLEEVMREVDAIKIQPHRPNPEILGGLVLNRITRGSSMALIAKIVQLEIKAYSQKAEVPILSKIKEMDSLTLLGMNNSAILELEEAFGGTLPSGVLDDDHLLTTAQVKAVNRFLSHTGGDPGIGIRHLAARQLGGMKSSLGKSLLREELELLPAVLELIGEEEIAMEYLDRKQAVGA